MKKIPLGEAVFSPIFASVLHLNVSLMKTVKKISWLIPGALILAAAFSRLLPHPYNFSPIAAMALLGGATIGKKAWAFILPIGALFISDLCFQLFTSTAGFYGWSQLVNYGAFAFIVVLGMLALRKITLKNVLFTSLGASALFFIVSNFGVWLVAGGVAPYTLNAEGLINTYVLGIPFLGNTVIGDLVYSGLLFGAYSLVQHFLLSKKQVVA